MRVLILRIFVLPGADCWVKEPSACLYRRTKFCIFTIPILAYGPKQVQNIIQGIVLPEQPDSCVANSNLFLTTLLTSTMVKKILEGERLIKEREEQALRSIAVSVIANKTSPSSLKTVHPFRPLLSSKMRKP